MSACKETYFKSLPEPEISKFLSAVGNFEIVSALLDFGSNPNIADHTGLTPLEIAREMGNREMVQKLREKGAN